MDPTKNKDNEGFSLWTAPPVEANPEAKDLPKQEDLESGLRELSESEWLPEKEAKRLASFKTPVTPDILSSPTQG